MEKLESSKPDIFTYDYYCQMIEILKERQFDFVHFTDELVKKSRKVYLRHDIDLNINDAVELAKLEWQLGVTSSYFVMLEAETYNAFSPLNRPKIKEIIALGHDVGLHFVPQIDLNLEQLEFQVKREVEILENLLQYQVSCFSIHRPPPGILSSDFCPQGLINTYDQKYFAKHKYISDSNHHFRCGDPIEFIENFQSSDLQILIHPVWWKKKSISAKDKIYKVIEDSNLINKNYVCDNINLAKTIL
jgi:hypothetical protein